MKLPRSRHFLGFVGKDEMRIWNSKPHLSNSPVIRRCCGRNDYLIAYLTVGFHNDIPEANRSGAKTFFGKGRFNDERETN